MPESDSHPPTPALPFPDPTPVRALPLEDPVPECAPVLHLIRQAAMPTPQSKRATRMFEGSKEEIVTFLGNYKHCAEDVWLPTVDWVKVMFRYLDRLQHLN